MFKPKNFCILFVLIYSMFGIFIYIGGSIPLNYLMSAAIIDSLIFILYTTQFKNREHMNRNDCILMLILSSIATIIIFFLFYNDLEIARNVLAAVVYISVPPVVSMLGIAKSIAVDENTSLAKYFVGIMVLPFLSFVLLNIISDYGTSMLLLIAVVFIYYSMCFLIIQAIVLYFAKAKHNTLNENPQSKLKPLIPRPLFVFIIAVFLPISGLRLNESLTSGLFSVSSSGLFGDFSSPFFYVTALLNGILLVFPVPKDNKLRIFLFYLKSVGYSYILYFFVVFMPIMPIGIIVLIILIGIYAFVPLIVTIYQGKHLWDEYKFLKNICGVQKIALLFVIGILTLPTMIFVMAYNDKANLSIAVKYIDGIGVNSDEKISSATLKRSLDIMKASYSSTSRQLNIDTGYSKGNIPIFTSMYSEYVADDEILNESNILALKSIFFNESVGSQDDSDNNTIDAQQVKLSDIKGTTVFDADIDAYRTWVDLEMTNGQRDNAEFSTTFTLPDGVYVSDYYLNVYGEDKKGILADRRAATSIYNAIVSRRRDPGLLRYIEDTLLELRVFPFMSNEIRTTGFELIHKGSFVLSIKGKNIPIQGDSFEPVETENSILLDAETVKHLPRLNRTPQYSFVIDCSQTSDIDFLKQEAEDYAKLNNITEADIYFTNYSVTKRSIQDINKLNIKSVCGFNLNAAVKNIYASTPKENFPVIMVFTSNMPAAFKPIGVDFELFPESDFYYAVNPDFSLTPYTFNNNKKQEKTNKPIYGEVADYKGYPVKVSESPQIIQTKIGETDLTDNQFENAMMLYTQSLYHSRNSDAVPVELVQKSFRINILCHSTAFITLETEEQEKQLLELQKDLLKEDYQPSPHTQSLSDPPILILFALAVLIFFIYGKTPLKQ